MIKVSIHQEDMQIVDLCVQYMVSKQLYQKFTDLKGEIHKYSNIVEDFNTLLSVISRV